MKKRVLRKAGRPEAPGVSTPPAQPVPGLPLVVRSAGGGDLGFIYSSWLNCLRHLSPWSGLDKNYFFAAQHALIAQLLARPDCVVLAACSPRNPDQIYGYVVAEPLVPEPLLHWLYTKAATTGKGPGYRGAGVATRLMGAAFPELGRTPITCSIRTPACAGLPAAWRISFNTQRLCRKVEAP